MMCVCDKIDWMENGWMDWIEWMWKVDGCGKWKVEGGAVPDLTQEIYHLTLSERRKSHCTHVHSRQTHNNNHN